jgi:polysaccharide biosynthesis transport protein
LNAAFSGSASSQAATAAPGRKIAPLASFRRHSRAAIVVAVSLMALGTVVAIAKGKPTYQAQAAIRISPVFSKTLQEDVELRFNSNSDYREFVQQQVVDIDSYETALAALRELGARRWLWQKRGETDRRAAERLMAALEVHPVPDTYLVTIGLEAEKRTGLADIVNAVAGAYLTRQQGQELYGSDRRVELLQSRRKELESQVKDDSQRQAEIGQELGVSTFEEKFINPYDKELVDANSALDTARRERIDAEAKLAALQSHIKRVLDLQVESQAQELLANDRALGDLRTELYRRKAVVFLQLRGLAPGHPGRRALEAEMADIDRELAHITQAALDRIRTMLLEGRANKAKEDLSQAEAKVEESRRTEAGLAAQLEALRERVAEFANRYNEAINLRAQSDRARKDIEEIDDRINFLTLESKAPGFVRLASRARPPEIPVKGGRTKLFVLFAIAGIGLGAALPVGIDFLDPRVLSPGELHKLLQFPPLGMSLEGSERLTIRGRDLVKHIALGIARERRASGNRLFVLTACHGGAGVTTLALDLAREIAALGVKALAVEANVEHVDKRYSLSASEPGLIEALAGAVAPAAALVAAAGEMPERMALGSVFDFHRVWKVNALRDLFARLSETYEVILIDAPPLLDSAEPELLIGLPAGVILVVMAREYGAVVRRAVGLLEKLSPPVVGAVLSRMSLDPEGGGEEPLALLPFGLPAKRLAQWFWHESE